MVKNVLIGKSTRPAAEGMRRRGGVRAITVTNASMRDRHG
jgi:hypothetical protein